MKTYNKGNYKVGNAIVTALQDWTGADEVRFIQSNHKLENGKWTDFICYVWNCYFNFSRNQPTKTFFFYKDENLANKVDFILHTKGGTFYAEGTYV